MKPTKSAPLSHPRAAALSSSSFMGGMGQEGEDEDDVSPKPTKSSASGAPRSKTSSYGEPSVSAALVRRMEQDDDDDDDNHHEGVCSHIYIYIMCIYVVIIYHYA